MITDSKHEARLEKLKGKSYEEALKLIYEWVKKDIITFKMFQDCMAIAVRSKRDQDNYDDGLD